MPSFLPEQRVLHFVELGAMLLVLARVRRAGPEAGALLLAGVLGHAVFRVKLMPKMSVARHLIRIEMLRTGTHPLLLGLGLVDEVVLGGRSLVRQSTGGMSMMRFRRHGSKMSIS